MAPGWDHTGFCPARHCCRNSSLARNRRIYRTSAIWPPKQDDAPQARTEGAFASASPPPPPPQDKPIHDVMAGAVARAAAQGTIHPLDTLKVQMQVGRNAGQTRGNIQCAGRGARFVSGQAASLAAGGGGVRGGAAAIASMQHGLAEVRGLYRGVGGAAAAAGIIIGTYFAFYSSAKNFLRRRSGMREGSVAFVAGAAAAAGSSVVKVPLAVCVRSVQAGMYSGPFAAAQSIVRTAGVRSLFTGFLPTVLEDVPDMAVKFAVYESLRPLHQRLCGGRQPTVLEDLMIGGAAGAAAAAATTPLDVLKTVMMCSASSRPTLAGAAASVTAQGRGGLAPFFAGVGPRALSSGLNSAIFFCFFEALRGVLQRRQQQRAQQAVASASLSFPAQLAATLKTMRIRKALGAAPAQQHVIQVGGRGRTGSGSSAVACLSLALPVRLNG